LTISKKKRIIISCTLSDALLKRRVQQKTQNGDCLMSKQKASRKGFHLRENQAVSLAAGANCLGFLKTELSLHRQPEGRACNCCGALLSQYNPGKTCHPCQERAFLGRFSKPKSAAV